MNDYIYEPEIYTVGDLQDLDNLNKSDYNDITTKSSLNFKDESDYHNIYYLGNNEYGARTLKMKNSEYLKLI